MKPADSVVLGAGPAGMSAAWRLAESGIPVRVVEKAGRIGGLAGTFQHGDFLLDYGPHKFYTRFDDVRAIIRNLMGDEFLTVPKKSGLWLLGKRLGYPFSLKDMALGLPPQYLARCGSSYLLTRGRQLVSAQPDVSYKDWVTHRFGRYTYELVFQPLASKIWGPPEDLDAELARVRIVVPNLMEMVVRQVMGNRGKPEISAKEYYYPRKGFGRIWDRIAEEVRSRDGQIFTGCEPERIEIEGDRVTRIVVKTGGGRETWPVASVVNTIPVSAFLRLMNPAPPKDIQALADSLKYRGSILFYMVVNKPRAIDDAWVFFPEAKYVFSRIAEQKAFSDEMGPADRTVVIADISCDPEGELFRLSDAALFEKTMQGIDETGWFKRSDVAEYFSVRIPKLYPVYDRGIRAKLDTVYRYLDRFPNIRSIGRHGFFQHNNSDNAADMGFRAADSLVRDESVDQWVAQRDRFHEYQIVD